MSGEEGLYVYDKLEGTVQRYNNNLVLVYQEKADNYFLYLLISVMAFGITFIFLVITLMKKKKHKNKFA